MQTPQFEGGNMSLVLFGFDTGDYNHVKLPCILKHCFCYNYALAIEDTRCMKNGYTWAYIITKSMHML